MPVKLGSKLSSENEAKIEVIPLIDIMFFLLASFMLVSLSMVNLKRVQVNLPTSTTATTELKTDLISVSVDKAGIIYLEKTPIGPDELARTLQARFKTDPKIRLIISGDMDARHRDMSRALDAARSAGIQNIAFEVAPPK
ncbi:MAG: biopolymer transporter ExbD [Puniceicoccales bacterium]|jgi:biopolymer transport protein ExbD|nr:biopolymer transporter ExbD [Puniceicoccales bacterium]